jgi:hypothetical protein
MIKKLFFTAALLVPGLAYAGNPSAPPAASDPTVPAPAAAAGFTTQVLNADFTAAQWANTATYITNCGAGTALANQPATWTFTFQIDGSMAPCGNSTIVSDGGSNALYMNWPVSQYSAGNAGYNFTWPSYFHSSQTSATSWLPMEYYVEWTWRSDSGTLNQSGGSNGGHLDLWATSMSESGVCCWTDENHFEEFQPPSTGFCTSVQAWVPFSSSSSACSTVDMTQYHKIGALLTSDESTNTYLCLFVDDVFVPNCVSEASKTSPDNAYTLHDRALTFFENVYGKPPVNDIHAWFRSIRMWACAKYATHGCPGTMVTHWPFP